MRRNEGAMILSRLSPSSPQIRSKSEDKEMVVDVYLSLLDQDLRFIYLNWGDREQVRMLEKRIVVPGEKSRRASHASSLRRSRWRSLRCERLRPSSRRSFLTTCSERQERSICRSCHMPPGETAISVFDFGTSALAARGCWEETISAQPGATIRVLPKSS